MGLCIEIIMVKNCKQCGKKFKTIPSISKKGKGKFCSRECVDVSKQHRIQLICKICGKHFQTIHSRKNVAKYCSRKCFKVGLIPWCKNTKGIVKSNSGSFKKGDGLGKKNHKWKGDNASCSAIHIWIKNHKGKPKICINCGATYKERKLHWSNIDHLYRRNLDDFVARCVPCHKKYDIANLLKRYN